MNRSRFVFQHASTRESRFYYSLAAVIFLALILSVVSWLRICTESCAEEHNYLLFGFSFEIIGILFFSFLLLIHLLSSYYKILESIVGYLLCGAIGAEVVLIYAQKYMIGSWCPICLMIAASVILAGLLHLLRNDLRNDNHFKRSHKYWNKGRIMNSFNKSATGMMFVLLGLFVAFIGLAKESELEAAENSVKEHLVFGSGTAPVTVYVFTDWRCPACRSLEPVFESIQSKIGDKADMIFVDDPVHPETMNFTPYNLSFIIHNKSQYFPLRNALMELSKNTKTPTEREVEAIASSLGIKFQPLDYADVALAHAYFDELIKKYDVEGTPIVVVATKNNRKKHKFSGKSEIDEESIMKTIDRMSK